MVSSRDENNNTWLIICETFLTWFDGICKKEGGLLPSRHCDPVEIYCFHFATRVASRHQVRYFTFKIFTLIPLHILAIANNRSAWKRSTTELAKQPLFLYRLFPGNEAGFRSRLSELWQAKTSADSSSWCREGQNRHRLWYSRYLSVGLGFKGYSLIP